MDKERLGMLLNVVGVGIGVMSMIVLVGRHPVLTVALIIGAVTYFVGEYIKKQ